MSKLKTGFIILVVSVVAAFLHYTLPRYEVVRIVGTEQQRMNTAGSLFFADGESASSDGSRDVRIVHAIDRHGDPSVFRNEDTGWGWPPYFKFNSANVHARATNLTSSEEEVKWTLVTRYGWRNTLLSIFPNVVDIEQVKGPEEKPFPWITLIILGLLAVGTYLMLRLWRWLVRRGVRVISQKQAEQEARHDLV